MNIALFPSAFHPSLGGVEELTRQLAHSLRDAGHTPIVITNRWPPSLPAQETFENLPLYRLPFYSPMGSPKAAIRYALSHRAVRCELLSILRGHAIDVIHIQCVSTNAPYAAAAARTLDLPLVVSLQGELTMDASHLYQRSAAARRMYRCTLAVADAITACSKDTLAEAESFFGQPFGLRGTVIPNGIRLADFSGIAPYIHQRPYMFAIGRHVPQKGFDVLLHAFAQALAHNPNLPHDLLLAGDGPAHAELRALAQSLHLADRVHFPGRTGRAQTAALFAGCDFFALPSRHEPQGIVNLEAMAAGKPVIATEVGGVPEIVTHNHNGLIVPPENPAALAAAILRIAADESLRRSFGQQACQDAGIFDWPRVVQRYLDIYKQTLERPPAVLKGVPASAPRIAIRGVQQSAPPDRAIPAPH